MQELLQYWPIALLVLLLLVVAGVRSSNKKLRQVDDMAANE